MKLIRLGPPGAERPALLHNGRYLDLRPLTDDIDGEFLSSGGLGRVEEALAAGELVAVGGAEDLRVGAPIARPSAVLCIGMNYAAHAAESGAAPPERPVLFLKTPNTVGGPDDPVQIPRDRKSGAEGKRLDLGGRRIIKKYISNILSRT